MVHTILRKASLTKDLIQMDFLAPRIAEKTQPGQFLIVRAREDSERIPLTIAASNQAEGSISIIFQVVGASTAILADLAVGQALASATGPLGKPSDFHGARRVLCVGGGVGTAVLFPQMTALSQMGVAVDAVVGARSESYLILQPQLRSLSESLYVCTDDGSAGHHGFVTQVVERLLAAGEHYDLCVAIGPPGMMRAVCQITKGYQLKTIVSLNPIMVDGTGMCGCCRVMVDGTTKYACVDGPDFDGHQVDFDVLMLRLKGFAPEEAPLKAQHPCGGQCHG